MQLEPEQDLKILLSDVSQDDDYFTDSEKRKRSFKDCIICRGQICCYGGLLSRKRLSRRKYEIWYSEGGKNE